jgi:hypothetical protein
MKYRYRSNKSKFYFSEKEIDFTANYINYSQFLLQEFFKADNVTKEIISNYYIQVYGSLSYSYLKRKYDEWAKGDYHLTDLMKGRILALMPKFLNENARHKLGIHEFMNSIKKTVGEFESSQKIAFRKSISLKRPQEIVRLFEQEYEEIQELKIPKYKFNVLSEDEKEEALEISKFIIQIKLQKAFDQIYRDFDVFLPYMPLFKRGKFIANYSITLFNINVELTNTNIQDLEIPKFRIQEIESDSRFKEYSDKYLAYELLELHKNAEKAVSNSFLNQNDISLLFAHYEELANGESEARINSTFQGEGGILTFKAEIKPLKYLKTSIYISSIKLAIYLILIATMISLSLFHKKYTLLIFGFLLLGVLFWTVVSYEIRKIRSLKNELKMYGK